MLELNNPTIEVRQKIISYRRGLHVFEYVFGKISKYDKPDIQRDTIYEDCPMCGRSYSIKGFVRHCIKNHPHLSKEEIYDLKESIFPPGYVVRELPKFKPRVFKILMYSTKPQLPLKNPNHPMVLPNEVEVLVCGTDSLIDFLVNVKNIRDCMSYVDNNEDELSETMVNFETDTVGLLKKYLEKIEKGGK